MKQQAGSVPGNVAVPPIVLQLGLVVVAVAVHAGVLALAGLGLLSALQLVDAVVLAVGLALLGLLVVLLLQEQPRVAVLSGALLHDYCFGEAFGLRVVVYQIVDGLVVAEAFGLVLVLLLLLHEGVGLVALVEPNVVGLGPLEVLQIFELVFGVLLPEGGRGGLLGRQQRLRPLLVDQEVAHVHLDVEVVLPVVGQELVEISCVEEHEVQCQARLHTELVIQLLHRHARQFGAVDDVDQLFDNLLYDLAGLLRQLLPFLLDELLSDGARLVDDVGLTELNH